MLDLNTRLNVNQVAKVGGESALSGVLRQFGPAAQMLRIQRPVAGTSESNEPSATEGTPIFDSFADLFEVELDDNPDSAATALRSQTAQLTCWGNGRLNFRRCSEQVLTEMGQIAGHRGLIVRFLRQVEKQPTGSLTEIVTKLDLSSKERDALEGIVQDGSLCWGVLISHQTDGPQVFVVREAAGGAFRTRTTAFRLR